MKLFNSNLFLLTAQTSVKNFRVFALLPLILLIVSCNQVQKQPMAQTAIKDFKSNMIDSSWSNKMDNSWFEMVVRILGKSISKVNNVSEGIETGDDKVLDAFYSKDFVLHGPEGDMNRTQLKASFTNLRNALTGFSVTREHVMAGTSISVAARTTFSGTFNNELKQSPVGPIKPTGKPVSFEVMSMFRYGDDGYAEEEWTQSDRVSFLKEFGVDVLKTTPKK
jgi:predicted ester cyclase